MRKLDDRESFVITRNGVPVGELTPLRRHRFVATETAIAMFETAPRVDYKRFRADLDAAASQEIEPPWLKRRAANAASSTRLC